MELRNGGDVNTTFVVTRAYPTSSPGSSWSIRDNNLLNVLNSSIHVTGTGVYRLFRLFRVTTSPTSFNTINILKKKTLDNEPGPDH